MNEKTQNFTNNTKPLSSAAGHDTVEGMTHGAHKGIDAASHAAHPAIDRVAAGAHKAVDSADDMANQAVEALDKAGVKGEELISAGSSYIREHPLLTLGLAVTAGYVLSRVLSAK